ncbi:MAG TPA: response regulator transcription factor [Marmoricola sp.]|nr:response regulator transcription factor [Marmoricola sp.]
MRLVICDDHRLLLESLSAALAQRGLTVEAAVLTPADAVRAVSLHDPDALLIDLVFPDGSGLDAAREVVARHPRTKVVVFTGSRSPDALVEALDAGVAGYLRKDQDVPEIVEALEAAVGGHSAVDRSLLRRATEPRVALPRQRTPEASLTPRERSVAALLVDGRNTDEIMHELGVSQSTVRTHVQSILTKLGVHTRLQAVMVLVGQQHPDHAGGPDAVLG